MSNPTGQSSGTADSSSNRERPLSNGGAPEQGSVSAAGATATMTITETRRQNVEVLQLTLRPRPSVQWDEGVIDNEGLGRKSSKRCCIFHKQRAFGESSTDSSEDDNGNDSDGSSSSGGPSSSNSKPIARKKVGTVKPKKVPDYQRFHA